MHIPVTVNILCVFMELNEMACIKSLEQSISLMNDNYYYQG